jgi:hypothetical protein
MADISSEQPFHEKNLRAEPCDTARRLSFARIPLVYLFTAAAVSSAECRRQGTHSLESFG